MQAYQPLIDALNKGDKAVHTTNIQDLPDGRTLIQGIQGDTSYGHTVMYTVPTCCAQKALENAQQDPDWSL